MADCVNLPKTTAIWPVGMICICIVFLAVTSMSSEVPNYLLSLLSVIHSSVTRRAFHSKAFRYIQEKKGGYLFIPDPADAPAERQ